MNKTFDWLNNNLVNFDSYIQYYWLRNFLIDCFFEKLVMLDFEIIPMQSPHELCFSTKEVTFSSKEAAELSEFGILVIQEKQSVQINLKDYLFLEEEAKKEALSKLDKILDKFIKLKQLYNN